MSAVVLLYHRIAELRDDPWGLGVTPGHLAEHLQALGRIGTFVPLSDVVTRASERELYIAISFDDGYADNLHSALPVLERFGVPATFFIATGLIDCGREFWWDELEQLTLGLRVLPARFAADSGLTIGLERMEGDVAHHAEPVGWRAWHAVVSARQRLFLQLWEVCRELSPERQGEFMESLRLWARGERTPTLRASHRPMSGAELARLAASPLATLGAHTRSHPRLSAWPAEVQRQEIAGSRDDLRRCGVEVSCFAYPYGGPSDYTRVSVDEVQRAGFGLGCAGWRGLIRSDTHPFELPRLSVQDGDGDQLLQQLRDLTEAG